MVSPGLFSSFTKPRPQRKILVIKLAAAGDVLRTTPILAGLKRKYPGSSITWVTGAESIPLLEGSGCINRILSWGPAAIRRLTAERFDTVISLDKEPEAAALAGTVRAKERLGFGFDKASGSIKPLNRESLYAVQLGIDDELKFRRNTKTYPEIIFEMCRLEYRKDEYVFTLSEQDAAYAQRVLESRGLTQDDVLIGLNTGAGLRFAHKAWTEDNFVELIRLIRSRSRARVVLLGGARESERNSRIAERAGGLAWDITVKADYNLPQFAGFVRACSLVLSGDTLAMHVAIALKKPVVALFGSTCEQEIELYGRGAKMASSIACRPCYKQACDKETNCMGLIRPQEVFSVMQRLLPL